MHHHLFERELVHLERIVACSPKEPFPPTYWRDRVEDLKNCPHAPLYRYRIARLSERVAQLSG